MDTIVSLPANALRLLARLLERKGPAIRLDEITYPEVEAPEEALRLLLKLGLLMELRHSWTRTEAFTVAELKASLRDSGLPVTGRKKELVDRLMGHHIVPQGRVVVPMVQDVVRRCEWLFFGLPGISRKRFLMERMGLQKWMSYAPSPARCPFESRDELLRYERIFRGQVDSAGLVRELSAVPMNDAEPPNFSLRVLLERRLRKLAEDFERDGEKAEALELYRVLSYFQRRPNAKVQRRMALCLDALGDPAKAAGVCQDGVGDHELSEAVGLARTGRRLARKAGISWRPSRPLLQAPVRRVGVWGNQHGWLGRGVPVERAVMSHLGERRVAWKEGGLWTSLFCLLFFDLLWDSSTGMLPAP
ncbi:MAG: SAP domain-containing protein, partial [Myxococcota bacterium]|nr:SAP domain-containing protein [Myxococcota bacterium]